MRIGPTTVLFLLTSLSGMAQVRIMSTYAGPPMPVEGVPAVAQAIDRPYGVVSDGAGGFFVFSIMRTPPITASGG